MSQNTPTPLPLALPTPLLSTSPESTAPPASSASALTLPAQLLPDLDTNLMVQAFTHEAPDAAALIRHAGVGAVFTLAHRRMRSPFAQASWAVSTTRAANPAADILIDRNRYSGNSRAFPDSPMSAQWIEDQLVRMGLPWAVGDPGFCRDLTDVRTVLDDGRRLAPRVVVPLAMPHGLLRDDADAIADLVNHQDKPIAIILEHKSDPFGAAEVARGLVHLIRRATVPVLLLRSDTSALGAISYGAAVGAVGTHSELRHVYPLTENGGGHAEHLALVIPDLVTFVLADRFVKAYLANPGLPTWRCGCWFCRGRDLVWIPNDPARKVAAFQHSVAAIAGLGAQLQHQAGITSPAQAWDTMCTTAQAAHDLVSTPSGTAWAPQDFLRYWHELTVGTPIS
jgi:hypothetical protein